MNTSLSILINNLRYIWIVVQTHWDGWLALTVFTHSLWEFRFRFLLTDVNNRIAGK